MQQKSLLIGVVLLASCGTRTEPTPNEADPDTARAEQALGNCSREGALPRFVELLRRQYTPWDSVSCNELTGLGPLYVFTPDVVPVSAGQSGNHTFTLDWEIGPPGDPGGASKAVAPDAPTPQYGTCLYRGTGSLPQSTTCTGNGSEYRLLFCTTMSAFIAYNCAADPDACANNPAVLGATSVPHGGLLEGATYFFVGGFGGDPCATTEATLTLLAPPDSNGDGIPECLQGDGAAPAWPAGRTLSATRSGASSATVMWTAATDNVGVAGYRLYLDGQLVRELDAQTLTATLAGLTTDIVHALRVEAFDAAGNVSTDGPTATILLDGQPPTWPAGSTLAAIPTAPSAATLVWTAALDNVAVTGYRVYRDGQLVVEVAATTLTATIGNLPSDVVPAFRVLAFDADGNASTTGPETILLLDASPPSWPTGSTLAVTSTGQGTAVLAWTAAGDNVGVTAYRVFRDGSLVAAVDAATRVATVDSLAVETTYTFAVQAIDAAGNVSPDGPQAALRLDGLAPIWPAGSVLSATPVDPVTSVLVWTAAVDNVAVAGYRIERDGATIREVDAGTLTATVAGLAPGAILRVQAFDAAGNVSSDGPQATFVPDLSAPTWPPDAVLAVVATGSRSVSVSWPAASDDSGLTEYRVVQGAIVVRATAPTQRSVEIIALDPEQIYTLRVDAVDSAGNVGAGPSATYRLGTVDPAVVAPPLDPRVSATLFETTRFLYDGPDAVQQGVTPGAIAPNRVALLRGRVLDRGGAPIRDVTVRVHGRPDLGHTRTRLDGVFDLVVNGGGALTLAYDHPGHFSVHRELAPDWQATLHAPDVILIAEDAAVTQVDSDVAWLQVARGTRIEDDDGERQATLLFPPATAATMRLPDGTTLPLETMHVRATEYTVGGNGPAAMPAELPKASAYTYAVELQVDEARAAGATEVTFS